ncbi:hypothetical protein [Spirochaeta cellobiosiphila]|uniref:hypothetical protein n=1 Tax=Spirochaeta cellobiosiphila TaxID=504483 RepID=UPI000417EB4B|nr:hypothetical protein [Spirochaeta cellobiosiphila]
MTELELNTFKRANFFSGLLATPQFWNDIQDYHFKKENFYNRTFNGFGVVPGILEDMRVRALEKSGALTLVVSPGFAIDALGRGVFLHEPKAIMLDTKKYHLPQTVFITVSYQEHLDDFYQNQENSEQAGYRKKIEAAMLEVVDVVEEGKGQIEIARIRLEEEDGGHIKMIRNPRIFTSPDKNELDFRYVTYAVTAQKALSPYLKDFLLELVESTRNISTVAYDALPLGGFREMQTVSLTAKMLLTCGSVNFEDVVHLIHPFFDINNQIVQEILDYERKEEKRYFSSKDDFENIRRSVYEMGDLIKYYDNKYETLDKILKAHSIVIEGIKSLLVTKRITLDDIALMSYDLPRVLLVQDERFTLVDFLDLSDVKSVTDHELTFRECKDASTSNQAFTYPDGSLVRDTIRRYVGGTAVFTIRNIIKNRKLILIRRTDIVRGNYSVDVTLGAQVTKSMTIDGNDSVNRWRNASVQFFEEEVKGYALPVEFTIGDGGRDNFGKIWVYQKL